MLASTKIPNLWMIHRRVTPLRLANGELSTPRLIPVAQRRDVKARHGSAGKKSERFRVPQGTPRNSGRQGAVPSGLAQFCYAPRHFRAGLSYSVAARLGRFCGQEQNHYVHPAEGATADWSSAVWISFLWYSRGALGTALVNKQRPAELKKGMR